jgi:DNA invertase Pin-like site-specific DNA recombinase
VLLIGYARVSKSDGSQTVAPQRNALLVAGVDPERIYEDLASGRNDARPGLIADWPSASLQHSPNSSAN